MKRILLAVAVVFGVLPPVPAAALEVPGPGQFNLQTNGPNAPLSRGDWYTSTAPGAGAGAHYLEFFVPCGWPSGVAISVDLFSAPMNANAGALAASEEPNGSLDQTNYELYGPGASVGPGFNAPAPGAGIPGTNITYAPETDPSTPESWTRFTTLANPQCGRYVLRSATADDDQNGFRVRIGSDSDGDPNNAPPANADDPDGVVGSGDELILGLAQISYQNDSGATACLSLYEYVAPDQSELRINNFDYDGFDIPGAEVRYFAPSGGVIDGTISNPDATWNGSNTVARGGDVVLDPEPGWWRFESCANNHNQFIQEGQTGKTAYLSQPPTPRLTLSNSDGVTEVATGQALTYLITATNVSNADPSPGAATNVVITDTLPSGATAASCEWVAPATGTCTVTSGVATGTLADPIIAGSAVQLRVLATVPSTATGTITNAASVSFEDAFANPFPAVDATDVDQVRTADLSIAKSDGGAVFTVGSPGTYALTVTNVSTVQTAAIITVQDTLPTGLQFVSGSGGGFGCGAAGQQVTCSRPASPALAAGASVAIVLTVNVLATAQDVVSNTATVSHAGDPVATNDTSTDSTTVSRIDLEIDKSHTDAFAVGESSAFLLTVRNVGSSPTTGTITVSDALPAGLSFVSASGSGFTCPTPSGSNVVCTRTASLGAGQQVAITLTVQVGASAAPSTTNSASVSTAGDASNANDADADVVAVGAALIGDRVFADLNGNGVQDPSEGGVGGVTVRLLDGGGSTVGSATTASDGTFQFTGLAAGSYRLEFVAPVGQIVTRPDAGANDQLDSDADPSSGRTPLLVVAGGSSNTTVDAGLFSASTLSGSAFIDANNDGVRSGSETGMLATVTLAGTDDLGRSVSRSITSDGATGSWQAADLRPGSYQVTVDLPPGDVATTPVSRNLVLAPASALTADFGVAARTAPANRPPTFSDASTNTLQRIPVGAGAEPLRASDPEAGAVTFRIVGGALPEGLTLRTDGSFAGSARTPGSTQATIEACDDAAPAACTSIRLRIETLGGEANSTLPRTGSSVSVLAGVGGLLTFLGLAMGLAVRPREPDDDDEELVREQLRRVGSVW